jgi:hypothetical protein
MVEQTPYTVIKKIGNVEIRQYPEIILAVVNDAYEYSAFGILFNYISGENTVRDKIDMTAPVISSTKIKMTTPVISQNHYLAFVLPSSYTKETVPNPTNPLVNIQVQPKRKVAVLRFGGRASTNKVENMTVQLLDYLQKSDIKNSGSPFLMRYNSPFAPGFLRRNEVAVEVF